MKKLKVLSYFNGMNCIGLALKQMGVEFELYACEIDKYANQVSSTLFPDTINLGDVRNVNFDELPIFDLIVGGSPCQGFSFAGKQLNFEDERSKLFFEFVKGVEQCKKKNPNVKFLLENVKMKAEFEAVISRFMGIDPIEINSSLLSAQSRKRLYWTNIGVSKANLFGIEEPGIPQPKDKGIFLKDILELEVDEKYYLSNKAIAYMNSSNDKFTGTKTRFEHYPNPMDGKAGCLTANMFKGAPYGIIKCARQVGRKIVDGKRDDNADVPIVQQIEPRHDGKSGCLTTVQKDNVLIVPEATNKGYTEIKDGGCVDLTFIDSKTRRGRNMEDKSNCLTASKYDFCQFKDAKIRRLTPKECARLQTIPEWAIEKMLNCGVSDSQLYKMLGNGWTVDVISYILSHHNFKK